MRICCRKFVCAKDIFVIGVLRSVYRSFRKISRSLRRRARIQPVIIETRFNAAAAAARCCHSFGIVAGFRVRHVQPSLAFQIHVRNILLACDGVRCQFEQSRSSIAIEYTRLAKVLLFGKHISELRVFVKIRMSMICGGCVVRMGTISVRQDFCQLEQEY